MTKVPSKIKWLISLEKGERAVAMCLIAISVLFGYIIYQDRRYIRLSNKYDDSRDSIVVLQKDKERQAIEITNMRITDKEKVDNRMMDFLNIQLEKSSKLTDSLVRVIKEVTNSNIKYKRKIDKVIPKINTK